MHRERITFTPNLSNQIPSREDIYGLKVARLITEPLGTFKNN